MMKVRNLIFTLPLFISFQCFAKKLNIIDDVEKAFNVEIILDTTFHGTWSVTYEKISDTTRVKDYLELLLTEYSKYPSRYLNNAKVNKIIICENLRYVGQKRAAIPDPYKTAMYLEIDSAYTKNYLIHVMHHELNHSAEYSLYSDMYYRWKKWERKNIDGFSYGGGGKVAYEEENAHIDYYTITHPKKGFANLYSTMGEEEDRSEVVAFLMTDEESKVFFALLKKDKVLVKKIKLAIKQMNVVSGIKFISWKGFGKNIIFIKS